MAYPKQLYTTASLQRRAPSPMIAVAILWGLAAVIIFTFLYSEFAFGDTLSKFYLLPWCLAAGAVIVTPGVYLAYKGKFDPFHPLVFTAWSYFFPGFVVGGFVLASGLSQPYFLSFIQDEHYNLPLTFVYVMLGFGGLTLGFALPIGRNIGRRISSRLPVWDWRTDQIATPGLTLFALGLAYTVLAFTLGVMGFQKVEESGAFDGLIFMLSLFWVQGSFLLWLYIFKSEKLTAEHYIILAILVSVSLARAAFQGNRGGIMHMLILVGFAFVFSQKKITLKHNVIGGILVTVALIVGMIYGTTYRAIKGTQNRSSISEIATTVTATGEKLTSGDLSSNLSSGFSALAERLEMVSSLAVIVSNYEALAPYEESYGMNNNIQNELTTFFIPRMVWADKPVPIEPSKYGDLYFNFTENSFAMTPMGDLLRNFGPIGVPIGMILLGLIIRILYSSLVENQPFSFWRVTVFFMLFTSISFEGTYGIIIPFLTKIFVITFSGILLLRFIIGRGTQQPRSQ